MIKMYLFFFFFFLIKLTKFLFKYTLDTVVIDPFSLQRKKTKKQKNKKTKRKPDTIHGSHKGALSSIQPKKRRKLL